MRERMRGGTFERMFERMRERERVRESMGKKMRPSERRLWMYYKEAPGCRPAPPWVCSTVSNVTCRALP